MSTVSTLAIAVALLYAPAAFATPTSNTTTLDVTTRVSNLRMGVVDLTPDDGSAAAYSFAVDRAKTLRSTTINYIYGSKSESDSYQPGTLQIGRNNSLASTTWSGMLGTGESTVHLAPGSMAQPTRAPVFRDA